jgi:hypothetical protein
MWLDLNAYFDKEEDVKDEQYQSVLADLGIEDDQTLEEISKIVSVRLRIDAVDEVITTKTENVSQKTMKSGMIYLVQINYNELIARMDEYLLR